VSSPNMDEKRLAEQMQAAKDDPDEWGEPDEDPNAVKRSPKRRLAAMVSVRLSPEELEVVQRTAELRGETVSAYLRRLALDDGARGGGVSFGGVLCSTTVRSIFISSRGTSQVQLTSNYINAYPNAAADRGLPASA